MGGQKGFEKQGFNLLKKEEERIFSLFSLPNSFINYKTSIYHGLSMKTLTYILGAVAGFFTFAGIGLIAKGFQVEGGITCYWSIESCAVCKVSCGPI